MRDTIVWLSFLLALAQVLSGCAGNTVLLPKEQGHYQVLSYAPNESVAMHYAMKKAQKTCKKQGQKLVAIDSQTKYQGVLTEAANKIVQNIQAAAEQMANRPVPTTSTSEDYKTTLNFRCE